MDLACQPGLYVCGFLGFINRLSFYFYILILNFLYVLLFWFVVDFIYISIVGGFGY